MAVPGDRFRHLLAGPVVVSPMAGGPSTPELVVAAAGVGALGFLAAGYKSAGAMQAEIDTVRAATGEPFGVNVFVPGAPAGDPAAVSAYLSSLSADAAAVGTELGEARWDDDDWGAKVDVLVAAPPPVVSFTFGCPPAGVVSALRGGGAVVGVTVTHPVEAGLAEETGVDFLSVQGPEAGAHRGTFVNDVRRGAERDLFDLLRAVASVSALPLLAAGGIMGPEAARAAQAAGAVAVQCGTAFLRCPESGAHPVHKAALADPRFTDTTVTRAFSGRPARGLVNAFVRAHRDAPPAYPEVNNATRPLRAAAAAAGDAERMSLWAGQGCRHARDAPAADVVAHLRGAP